MMPMHILNIYHNYIPVFSSVSSALNSLSAVILEDFVKPLHLHLRESELAADKAAIMTKLLGDVNIILYYCKLQCSIPKRSATLPLL